MDAPTEPLTATLPDDAREAVEASLAAGEFATAAKEAFAMVLEQIEARPRGA